MNFRKITVLILSTSFLCLSIQRISFGQSNDIFSLDDQEGSSFRSGVVKPVRQALLSFAQSGFLAEAPEEGRVVKKGEVIARLDESKLRMSLAESKAAFKSKQLSVQTALHKLNKTKRLLEEKILAPIAITEDEFGLKRAEAELEMAQAKLEASQLAVDECRLVAPFDGVIVNVSATLGEQILSGKQIAELVQVSQLQITLDVPLQEAAILKSGMETSVLIGGKKVGTAQVKTIVPLLDAASGLQRVIWSIQAENEILVGRYVILSPWNKKR